MRERQLRGKSGFGSEPKVLSESMGDSAIEARKPFEPAESILVCDHS